MERISLFASWLLLLGRAIWLTLFCPDARLVRFGRNAPERALLARHPDRRLSCTSCRPADNREPCQGRSHTCSRLCTAPGGNPAQPIASTILEPISHPS